MKCEARIAVAAWGIILFTATACCAGDADMGKATLQAREFFLEKQPAASPEATQLASRMLADGSWPDVDYDDKSRSGWLTAEHVDRIVLMAKVLRAPCAEPARQEALAKSINSALAYWRQHDFKCPNWFHNRIGVPQRLCEIALLLDDRFQKEDLEYLTTVVETRCQIGKSTGQNRVWLAGIRLMHGLITRNADRVADAASMVFAEAVVVKGAEGIQRDYSFHQHGAQLQLGSYGLSFAGDQIKWWMILRGTRWAMPEAGREVMRHYLLNGQSWVVWRGDTDISCLGRGFAPGFQASKGAALASIMERMPALDPDRSGDYAAFAKRNTSGAANDLTGCRCFWRSDYMVHRRQDFCITLKMSSKRVKGSESLNGQNLSGYHLADGVTCIYREGQEYRDIFPVWNWRMLPGVTCAQTEGPMPRFGSYKLDSEFVGGVSDGENGCAVLDYRRDGVSAKKSWFFLGDQVVCLGSGIRAAPEVKAPVATTVNQCRLRGPVRISEGKTVRPLEAGSHHFDEAGWIEHDGMRYTLLAPQKISVSNQRRTGHWSKVANTPKMPKDEVAEEVFSLSVDHGAQPVDGVYAYCISPALRAELQVPEVVSNTSRLQAARVDGRAVGAVFHVPGRLEYMAGRFAEVSSPCLLLLGLREGKVKATVADPTQALTRLSVTIDGKHSEVSLPSGDEAGRSVPVQ